MGFSAGPYARSVAKERSRSLRNLHGDFPHHAIRLHVRLRGREIIEAEHAVNDGRNEATLDGRQNVAPEATRRVSPFFGCDLRIGHAEDLEAIRVYGGKIDVGMVLAIDVADNRNPSFPRQSAQAMPIKPSAASPVMSSDFE